MMRLRLFGLAGACGALLASAAGAQGPSRSESATVSQPPPFAAQVVATADAVLTHHLDPPTRQQMILAGLKAVYEAAGQPPPQDLARKVSALATPEQFEALLAEPWPKPSGKRTPLDLEDAFVEGMLGIVPGGANLVSAKEQRVTEQFEGNAYVGIQVALGLTEDKTWPVFQGILEGGPADRAGIKKGEVIEAVDGVCTEGLELKETVDRLRGPEGTDVKVTVRDAKSGKVRNVNLIRGLLPRKSITGIATAAGSVSELILVGPVPIGYLRFTEISGSTPQELRRFARKLEDAGARGVVLDLRPVSQANFHATVLVADALLDSGVIGKVRTAHSEMVYRAEPDTLFRDQPIAVLVDGGTKGPAEWLAAALQDHRRAVVLGYPTAGAADVLTPVPILDGAYVVVMTTGRMERADGRPLAKKRRPGEPEIVLNAVRRRASERRTKENEGGVTPEGAFGPEGVQDPILAARNREKVTGPQPPPLDPTLEAARKRLVTEISKTGP